LGGAAVRRKRRKKLPDDYLPGPPRGKTCVTEMLKASAVERKTCVTEMNATCASMMLKASAVERKTCVTEMNATCAAMMLKAENICEKSLAAKDEALRTNYDSYQAAVKGHKIGWTATLTKRLNITCNKRLKEARHTCDDRYMKEKKSCVDRLSLKGVTAVVREEREKERLRASCTNELEVKRIEYEKTHANQLDLEKTDCANTITKIKSLAVDSVELKEETKRKYEERITALEMDKALSRNKRRKAITTCQADMKALRTLNINEVKNITEKFRKNVDDKRLLIAEEMKAKIRAQYERTKQQEDCARERQNTASEHQREKEGCAARLKEEKTAGVNAVKHAQARLTQETKDQVILLQQALWFSEEKLGKCRVLTNGLTKKSSYCELQKDECTREETNIKNLLGARMILIREARAKTRQCQDRSDFDLTEAKQDTRRKVLEEKERSILEVEHCRTLCAANITEIKSTCVPIVGGK